MVLFRITPEAIRTKAPWSGMGSVTSWMILAERSVPGYVCRLAVIFEATILRVIPRAYRGPGIGSEAPGEIPMTILSLALAVLVTGADGGNRRVLPIEATADDVRKALTKSLPFLKDRGMAWMKAKKCASCHHVPMMLWTHTEARRRGFAVGDTSEAQSWALDTYLDDPELMPTGQDKGFPKTGPGPGAVYLALGLDVMENPGATEALEKLTAHFAGRQEKDGSWSMKEKQPPLVDGDDVATIFILLAIGRTKETPALRTTRERAMSWLRSVEPRPETQSLGLRVTAAAMFDKEQVRRLVNQLQVRQNEDGGWSQIEGRPSDALATGQALYALVSAGAPADSQSIRRAVEFCVRSQREDGSWYVKTRNPTGHDEIISYYGTGWATLGLLRSLPR